MNRRESRLMAVHAETLELELLARGSDAARQRFHHLRRLLFVADMLAGVASGALVGVVARGSGVQVLLLAVIVAVAWPVAAFLCGLYAREDLRAWASGVSEAPGSCSTCLALSWPMLRAARLDGPRTARGGRVLRRDRVRGRRRRRPLGRPRRRPPRPEAAPADADRRLRPGGRAARRAHQRPSRARARRSTGFIDDGAGDQRHRRAALPRRPRARSATSSSSTSSTA